MPAQPQRSFSPSFDFASEVERVAALANAAKRGVDSDDDVRAATVVVASAVAMTNRLYSARRRAGGGKGVDAYFTPLERRLRTIVAVFRGLIADYQKRAPSQFPHKATDRCEFEIVNWEDVPLERLRPYFEPSAVDAAIRMALRLGVAELPGVRIYAKGET